MQTAASSRLRRLAQRSAGEHEATLERCELCGAPIPAEHRHLLDVASRELKCTCRPCSILFDRRAASEGRYRLVGDRRLAITDFVLDDLMWEELRLPVEMAFFVNGTVAERVQAFYPSPMGPTESLLTLEAWLALEAANPVLRTLEPDVEALLVNRARGQRRYYLVPIDECYALVGLIRTRWRGLTGGTEVWQEIGAFFEQLDRRARPASRSDGKETTWRS
jgi:Family of unknown function (DUF5947)